MKKTFISILLFGALIALSGCSFSLLGDYNPPTSPTNGSATLSTSYMATQVLAANGGRTYAIITNNSANVVYLFFAASSTISNLNGGVRLAASGGSYVINKDNAYVGAVSASSSAPAANKLIYIEK